MSRAVVALGGNALLGSDEAATIENQRDHVRETVDALSTLRARGYELVLTHGNGPQVGTLLLEQEDAAGPEYPLDVLVAETQAQVGYIVASEFDRAFDTNAVSIITRVLVNPDDPDFDDPSKPVGPYYDSSEISELDFDVSAVRTSGGKIAYRRVVPSPKPTSVVESGTIQSLVESEKTVVCAGGGGVPLVETTDGRDGVEAVVDKDYTSRLVGAAIDASILVMITDVPCVYSDFGSDEQERITELSAGRARELLGAGEFSEGSMAPKIRACVRFVETSGDRAIVCSRSNLEAALDGTAGTTIRP